MKFYQKTVEQTLGELNARRGGLTSREAAKRLRSDGANRLEIRGEPLWKKIIEPFANVMIGVLFIAGLLSLWHGEFIDATIVFVIIMVSAVIDWVQQYSTERILRSLRSRENERVEVYRDGNVGAVAAEDLVRGDVIILHEGQKIPADARLMAADNLNVDESMLTGESLSVKKSPAEIRGEKEVYEQANMLFNGSFVVMGAGVAVVVATGNATEFGQLAKLAGDASAVSPMQQKVDKLIKWVVVAVFAVAALAFGLQLARGTDAVEALRFILAFAVSAVPEGLPIAITVVLALGMRRMAAKKALVRNMRAIENIGLVTTVATDKTGTLTRNELRVQDAWSLRFNAPAFALQTSFALNVAPGKSGDPLDAALAIYLNQNQISAMATRAELVKSLPFDYTFAMSGNVWQFAKNYEIYVKGAPEKILERCKMSKMELAQVERKLHEFAGEGFRVIAFAKTTAAASRNSPAAASRNVFSEPDLPRKMSYAGQPKEPHFSNSDKSGLEKSEPSGVVRNIRFSATNLENGSEKSFAKAADFAVNSTFSLAKIPHSNLEFLGLIAVADELRPRVAAAVREATGAGVRVRMITGDHAETAYHIAREIDIADNSAQVYDSRKLMKLSPDKLAAVVAATRVYARVIPEAKHKILTELNKTDITAMTGDGVNDVPALTQAHVGIAMGAGAAIAKDASDIVLLDNNFKSIVTAIREGRIIIANVRRMLVYLIATNAGEVLVTLGALFLGLPLPLVAVQILWVNLATDTFMVIPLGLEPGDKNIMKQPPADPRAPLLDKFLLARIILTALAMTVIVLGVFTVFLGRHSLDEARSAAFLVLIVIQWVNALAMRGEAPLAQLLRVKNRVFFLALAGAVILQLIVMFTPALREALHLEKIHLDSVWACLLAMALMAAVLELHKWLGRRRAQRRQADLAA